MKPSPKTDILYNDEKQCCGIFLKADFVAEHEWGIKDINSSFGIPPAAWQSQVFGLLGYQIKYCPEGLQFVQRGKAVCLSFSYYSGPCDPPPIKEDISSKWSSSGFSIVSVKYSKELRELYEAFKKLDISIFIGGKSNNPFDRGGLSILIPSRVNEKDKKLSEEADLEMYKKYQASKKINPEPDRNI
jgi:hypothetical protein